MKYNIIKEIKDFIDEHNILRDYETFEQMQMFYRIKDLDCLSTSIAKEHYTPFFADMAIMFVNMGLLYAKSQLSEEEQKDYLIYWGIEYIEENIVEDGFLHVDVCYTRKGKEHLSYLNEAVDYKNTKIYKYVKDVIGMSEFTCYYTKSEEDECESVEYYCIIPKKIEQQIRQS